MNSPSREASQPLPPQQSKRSWSAFIPRPGSSGGASTTSADSIPKRPRSAGGIKGTFKGSSTLEAPREGEELRLSRSSSISSTVPQSTYMADTVASPIPTQSTGAGFPRSNTYDQPPSRPSSRPTTPKRWVSNFSLTTSSPKVSTQSLDQQANQIIGNALERTQSASVRGTESSKGSGGFGKSLSSMMGGLSALSLSRTNTRESATDKDDKDRGRSMLKLKRIKSASQAPHDERDSSRSHSRARSSSPFSFRRFRTRDPSPTPQPVRLSTSDADLSDTAPVAQVRPRSTAYNDSDSDDENATTDAESDDEDMLEEEDEDIFDPITEANTELNAVTPLVTADAANGTQEIEDPDPVGEGVNVVVAPEPYFPTSLNALGSRNNKRGTPRRRKSVKVHEPLPFHTSRPVFQRDRCTITITQGEPEAKLGNRRRRRYVVASDLSEESRYAVEWGIGTVLRDGDDMTIVTVVENEAKVDPAIPSAADRAVKLRSQQERQGLAYILARQVTGLLQRTKLNVTIACQAWHAKNSRHMLLDIVDHIEPVMLIVGSRGLGQLNGILLGSTSHYLIEKCSVPVMVARRRLKRPPKKNAHLSTHRVHVSLAEAGIDRVAAKVDQDVQVMREEIQKDDASRRDGNSGNRDDARFENVNDEGDNNDEDDGGPDSDDEPEGVKVAG